MGRREPRFAPIFDFPLFFQYFGSSLGRSPKKAAQLGCQVVPFTDSPCCECKEKSLKVKWTPLRVKSFPGIGSHHRMDTRNLTKCKGKNFLFFFQFVASFFLLSGTQLCFKSTHVELTCLCCFYLFL